MSISEATHLYHVSICVMCIVSLVVKGKLGKTSKSLKTLLSTKFPFAFFSLSIAQVVKKSHIQVRTYFIFLKHKLKQMWNSSHIKFGLQRRDQEKSYQATHILVIFTKSIALNLGQNNVKGLIFTKILK